MQAHIKRLLCCLLLLPEPVHERAHLAQVLLACARTNQASKALAAFDLLRAHPHAPPSAPLEPPALRALVLAVGKAAGSGGGGGGAGSGGSGGAGPCADAAELANRLAGPPPAATTLPFAPPPPKPIRASAA